MLNVFVTGINNGVGKTFITAGLAATMQSLGYQTCVYNPIQLGVVEKNGFVQSKDSVFLKTLDPYIKTFSSYTLKGFEIPALAAENENIFIERHNFIKDFNTLARESDCVITELAGGIMTPLAQNYVVSDLVKDLDSPVLVVIKPDSDINQILLTINHAQEKGLKIRGVVINNYSIADTAELKVLPRLIEEYSGVKILGLVKNFSNAVKTNANTVITEVLNGITVLNLEISLNKNSHLFNFKINWENKEKNHLLQAKFNLPKPVATTYSQDFGELVERNFDPNYDIRKNLPEEKGIEAKTNTAPFQKYVCTQGFSVVTKGLCEYEVAKNSLLITLLRATGIISNPKNPARLTPAGPPIEVVGAQQLGANSVEFAIGFSDCDNWKKSVQEIYPYVIVHNE